MFQNNIVFSQDFLANSVWIEFEDIQHALDAAGKLGGYARGFTVCVGDPTFNEPLDNFWMPPHVKVTGNRANCRWKDVRPLPATLTATHDDTIESLTFEGDGMHTKPAISFNEKSDDLLIRKNRVFNKEE
jgi:hypothetical protein